MLIGGPPCQGFANRWTHDGCRNRLFFEFVELADHIQPKAIRERSRQSRGTTDMQGILFQERGYNVCRDKTGRNFFVMKEHRF